MCQTLPQAGGGDSYPMRVYRAVYQARSSMEGMWRGNPILTALLFGLPAGFLSLICYSICCQDIMDAEDEDEGELVLFGRGGGVRNVWVWRFGNGDRDKLLVLYRSVGSRIGKYISY